MREYLVNKIHICYETTVIWSELTLDSGLDAEILLFARGSMEKCLYRAWEGGQLDGIQTREKLVVGWVLPFRHLLRPRLVLTPSTFHERAVRNISPLLICLDLPIVVHPGVVQKEARAHALRSFLKNITEFRFGFPANGQTKEPSTAAWKARRNTHTVPLMTSWTMET